MRSALFWGIMQRQMAILYRRFGTAYRPHIQGFRSPKSLLDFADVSGQHIGPILKGRKVQKVCWTLPTFRDSVSVLYSKVKKSKKFVGLYRRFGTAYRPIFKGQEVQKVFWTLPTFRDSIWVPYSRVKKSKKYVRLYRRFGTSYRSRIQGSRSPRSMLDFTDVSGQHIGPIFKCQEVQKVCWTLPTFRNSISVPYSWVKKPKNILGLLDR
jgi:hypothetical protein